MSRRVARLLLLAVLCAASVGCEGTIDDARAFGKHVDSKNASDGSGAQEGHGAEPVDCSEVRWAGRKLWRLTPTQYDNTIRDLLGLEGRWGESFPADPVVEGYANNAATLHVTPLLADKLAVAAEDIAARADLASYLACSDAAEGCVRAFVERFGERAFRRPLAPHEVARYLALVADDETLEAALRTVVAAMLQSPHFLYRRELGRAAEGRFELDDYEIASELSYLVWQSMPDETLLAAARAFELHTPAQIEAQLVRLVSSPRARPTVRAFVVEWLGLGNLATVPKDTGRFPELTDEIRAAMQTELERFVDHVLFEEKGSLGQLLTSPSTFLNEALARFYGDESKIPADGHDGFQTELEGRTGLLTLGAVMMLHARSNDSSPVHRGRLVRERLLCQVPPPPPPGIVVEPPPLDPDKTARERYAAHSSVQPCVSCHRLMDPIGFAFEHFDGVGRYRKDDHGQPIDVSGEIVDTAHTDGSFHGTAELAHKLAESPDVRACFAEQWLRFAYGLGDDARGHCVMQRVQAEITRGEGTLTALLHATALDEHLRYRARLDPAPGAGAAGGLAPEPNETPTVDAGVTEPTKDAGTNAAMTHVTPPSVTLERVVDDDFGSGYCHTYELRNQGSAEASWEVVLSLSGTLTQHWEAVASVMGTRARFTGVAHNATLAPGASTRFGFCVQR